MEDNAAVCVDIAAVFVAIAAVLVDVVVSNVEIRLTALVTSDIEAFWSTLLLRSLI